VQVEDITISIENCWIMGGGRERKRESMEGVDFGINNELIMKDRIEKLVQ
jgi:hypothetical protein